MIGSRRTTGRDNWEGAHRQARAANPDPPSHHGKPNQFPHFLSCLRAFVVPIFSDHHPSLPLPFVFSSLRGSHFLRSSPLSPLSLFLSCFRTFVVSPLLRFSSISPSPLSSLFFFVPSWFPIFFGPLPSTPSSFSCLRGSHSLLSLSPFRASVPSWFPFLIFPSPPYFPLVFHY